MREPKCCMSSDDIVRRAFFVLHNGGECGQNDALCLSEDCREYWQTEEGCMAFGECAV